MQTRVYSIFSRPNIKNIVVWLCETSYIVLLTQTAWIVGIWAMRHIYRYFADWTGPEEVEALLMIHGACCTLLIFKVARTEHTFPSV